MQQAQHILKTTFGYSEFRFNQADIIQALLTGNDALAIMPTGGGKSLCYQVPALIREGTGIVISPLIALMQDQVSALRQLGVNAAYINSTLDFPTLQNTTRDLIQGRLDLLYIAPERLLSERMLNLLNQSKIALFAIDEAHCVSQWGHDFRKEYQQLRILHEHYPEVPRIALTATADPRTRQEIIEQLNLQQAAVFMNSFDRPNIYYAVSDGQNPRDQLWRFIQQNHPGDAGIVYCLSRNKVDAVTQWLNNKGREALAYHAGLSDQVRQHNQARFLREDSLIIVATVAFGMGIDKPDVRFVAHLNLPKNIEAYYQETGRAGRDGAPANAWMAYGLQDVIMLRQMTQNTDANEQFKRIAHHKLEAILGFCELTTCRRQVLVNYFGETMDQACGNCDNCTKPPVTWDGTTTAQKALSCVYRTGQRFGVNYLIDVLAGKDDSRIKSFRHDQLSTYGIGKELSNVAWRSVFRQLIAQGYLSVDLDGHGALKLTEQCRAVFRGETQLTLRTLPKTDKTSKANKTKPTRKLASTLQPSDEPLFQTLRALRHQLAKEHSVPPYVIFHDSTLIELAKLRPSTLDDMHLINGVGEQKLKRYGQLFLDKIHETE